MLNVPKQSKSFVVQSQTPVASPNNSPSLLPPPPPPFPMTNTKPVQSLPSYLKLKKSYQSNVPMKKLNWITIDPRNIAKNCFWAKCQEDKLASQDILAGLSAKFSQKSVSKFDKNPVAHPLDTKKCVALRVISQKSAFAISILLRSTLKQVSYEQFKERILLCDTSKRPF